ncbi:hypothetical protein, partial [Candidatus Viridilinea mediisalina]|uniref:hypothetical protein n=1 Tax=Candidatus Viridilinea mediisalina TaxID=2024553 RepID=UPI0010556E13
MNHVLARKSLGLDGGGAGASTGSATAPLGFDRFSHRAAWLRQAQPPRRLASTGSATAPLGFDRFSHRA